MYVYIYAYIYIYIYINTHICIQHMSTYMYIHIYIHLHRYTSYQCQRCRDRTLASYPWLAPHQSSPYTMQTSKIPY